MWITPLVLEGPSLRLEPLHPSHAQALFAAADPELFRFTPQAPSEWSPAGFEQEITKVISLPDVVAFAIVRKENNLVIGRTTYMDIKAPSRGVEIGRTWISRPYHGSRVNPEIKFLMLRHAFETLAPTAIRVQLTTGGSNLHSQHAIARLGATREGILRSHRIVPSTPDPASPPIVRDTVIYSILGHEWPDIRARLLARLQ